MILSFSFLVVAKHLICSITKNCGIIVTYITIRVITKRVKIPFQYSSPVHSSPVFTDSPCVLPAVQLLKEFTLPWIANLLIFWNVLIHENDALSLELITSQ